MSYLENIRTFVRVYELGSMSAAGRDLRISPAVTSARISKLEDHLGVRLFQRTTRELSATEQGRAYYGGACAVLEAVENAETQVMNLTDRKVDLTTEGLDLAFFLGKPEDSTLRIRKIADVARVLCAAPAYVETRGNPVDGDAIITQGHECLNLRFPGAPEFQWPLRTDAGPKRFRVSGRYESDDGDVLTEWALDGQGIALKPIFEVADHLASGSLVPVAQKNPPMPIQLACLYTHRRLQDPKTRLFMEFVIERIADVVKDAEAQLPR